MIAPTIFVLVVVALLAEALILWLDQLHRHQAEAAYWAARNSRPDQYDWAKELDL